MHQIIPFEELKKEDIVIIPAFGTTLGIEEMLQKLGIEVQFQDYKHPVYSQHLPGFLPNMAAIDALFCIGKMPNYEVEIAKEPVKEVMPLVVIGGDKKLV